MSLFNELKRRNVLRVAAAYIVAAWLLIQIAETIFPLFGFDDTPARIVVIVLAIGFIPAMIFAWAFELTPEGLKKESEIDRTRSITPHTGKKLDQMIMVVLVFALAYFAFDKFVLDPQRDVDIAESATKAGEDRAREEARLGMYNEKSVAVLPFVNRSERKEDEFFTDGMHDELLTRLSRIGSLKVISRTSMMHYRDTEMTIPEIARELSVATILEGGVQRSGDQVRINVQLIDAHTDEHLWSEIYDRELNAENLFAIQSEISISIAEALNATLSPEEHVRVMDVLTVSLEANNHYMRGRQLMINRRTDELLQAVSEFEAAVEIDPKFTLAWVGIADATMLLGDTGAIGYAEEHEIRIQAVDKALALNDQLGEVYVAYGDNLGDKGLDDEARVAFLKAIELAPNYALAYHRYAFSLTEMDELEQKVALYQKAIQLDPMSPVYQINLTAGLLGLGRDEEAMQQLKQLLELSPDFVGTYSQIANIHYINGRIVEAIGWSKRALRMDPVNGMRLNQLAYYYIALEYYEGVAQIRQLIAEQLTPNDWRPPNLDLVVLMRQLDWQGALDLSDFWSEGISAHPHFQEQKGNIYYFKGDLHKTREYWSKLKNWPAGETGDCTRAHVLMATGNETQGREILNEALYYLEVTLPGLTQHTDIDDKQGICYLLTGDHGRALDFFEERTAHGHFSDWWEIRSINLWDALRDDPRFIALDQKIEGLLVEQRELLQQMEESGDFAR